jgi:Tol biopolymer transport system component
MRVLTNTAFVLLLCLLGLAPTLWGQRGKPKPPEPPPDPAIAYTEAGRLLVMNADGSNKRVVFRSGKGSVVAPNWSPDAHRLVFIFRANDGKSSGVYLINLDGTGLCKIAPKLDTISSIVDGPDWSPVPLGDGNHWVVYADTGASWRDLYAVRADCANPGTPVNLTNTATRNEAFPTWSRHATQLAAGADDPPQTWGGIVVFDVRWGTSAPELTNRTSLADVYPFAFEDAAGGPSYGKSDDRILFYIADNRRFYQSGGKLSTTTDLWVSDRTYSGTSNLTNSPERVERFPNWSPGGDELVFAESTFDPATQSIGPPYSIIRMTRITNADGTFSWAEKKLGEGSTGMAPPIPKWRRCEPCP